MFSVYAWLLILYTCRARYARINFMQSPIGISLLNETSL
jgi:hypothetical protein